MIFAYVDPGLGLLTWQAVVAFFLGLLFYLKQTRCWLVKLFRKVVRTNKPPEQVEPALTPPRNSLRQ